MKVEKTLAGCTEGMVCETRAKAFEQPSFRRVRQAIYADLYRYRRGKTIFALLLNLVANPGFCYTFWLRICRYLHGRRLTRYTFFPLARFLLWHYSYRFGILISFHTEIDDGLFIGHFGGIVISNKARIGRNCNVSHGVTIGDAPRGKRPGTPVIGDNVFIGPGAKMFGAIAIGNNAAIGANSVVTTDVPANAVVVGIPAKVISFNGSEGYIQNTDYGP